MTNLKTILGVTAALSLGALAAPADSATIAITGGPFSGTNPIGAFPVIALNSSDTYDFTFSLVPPLGGDTQEQIEAQSRPTVGPGSPEPIQFDLYSGTPTGSNSRIATSTRSTSAFLAEDLAPGNYFVQVTPGDIAVNNEVLSGSLVTASVPEPASWALMILGVGAIGATLRGRRRLAAA